MKKKLTNREIDTLVASLIMELPITNKKYFDDITIMETGFGKLYNEGSYSLWLCPKYTEDMTSAWDLVEKIGLVVGKNNVYPEMGKWVCLDDMSSGENWLNNPDCGTYAAAAPLAICLAALKSIGVDVE